MQKSNRLPMDERKEPDREQDTQRERVPNRSAEGDYSGSDRNRGIENDNTPGERKRQRSEPLAD